jgi:hypothetical protein
MSEDVDGRGKVNTEGITMTERWPTLDSLTRRRGLVQAAVARGR